MQQNNEFEERSELFEHSTNSGEQIDVINNDIDEENFDSISVDEIMKDVSPKKSIHSNVFKSISTNNSIESDSQVYINGRIQI